MKKSQTIATADISFAQHNVYEPAALVAVGYAMVQ